MTFEKNKRIVDEDLLHTVRRLPCVACSYRYPEQARAAITDNDEPISHPHHVISRGAGGHDVATNLLPLCPTHHREIHQIGNTEMALLYPTVMNWLTAAAEEMTTEGNGHRRHGESVL